jgi:hypothetical protein
VAGSCERCSLCLDPMGSRGTPACTPCYSAFVIKLFVILAQLRRVLEGTTWREVVSAVHYAWTRWDHAAPPLARPVATSSAGPVSLVGKNCQLHIKLVRPVYPAFFVSDLQDVNKKKSFFAYYFLKVHLHHFSKINSHKEVTKQ